ncbi:hypothetical protein AC249_AIPGENE22867 [Exaiptasia diaphana]|nr:hypothetical protein AC249_AIPGENE22867 [Exaiptasia diaphana]
MSVERFRATRQTLQKQRPYTPKQRMTVLGFCWLIPMLFAVYFTYVDDTCSIPMLGKSHLLTFLAHEIFVVILCCLIFALGILTTRRLSRPQPIHAHLNEQQLKKRVRRTQAAVQMVIASVLLYACCSLSYLIFNALRIADSFFPSVDIMDDSACIDWRSIYFIIYKFLLVVNSCFSPLIYIVFLPDFKEAAKKVLFRGRETQNQAPNGENSIEMQPAPNRERTGQNLSQVVANHN